MDRTTTYVVLALVILLGIGALIYANTATVREPTNAPGTATTGPGTGAGGTIDRTTPPPAPATPPPPATRP